jgi:SAM-dependent methyltransferase
MKILKHSNELPLYDDQGRNLVDPKDSLGFKTEYITRVHSLALMRYVGQKTGHALDVGCGYGRMAIALESLGWSVTGLDPSVRILKTTKRYAPEVSLCAAALPQLPVQGESVDLVLAQNLLRVLHLNGILDAALALTLPIKAGGQLVIIDNIRDGHPEYVPEDWILAKFHECGLRLKRRVAIRSSRWPPIYAIRYGLVPQHWLDWIAEYELARMAKTRARPTMQYHNVMFVFEK